MQPSSPPSSSLGSLLRSDSSNQNNLSNTSNTNITNTQQQQLTTSTNAQLDLAAEKQIVRNVLLRVFNPQMTNSLMKTFYPGSSKSLQFYNKSPSNSNSTTPSPPDSKDQLDLLGLNGASHSNSANNNNNGSSDELNVSANLLMSDEAGDMSPAPTQDNSRVWCRFQIDGFTLSHFAKDVFPAFTVSLVQLNGEPLPRIVEDGVTKPMADMRIRMTIRNKWTEVSAEVLPDTEFIRTLRDGKVEINDLVFQDVTLKHGGYFVMHITAVDYGDEVLEWKSEKFVIQSVKTHCNKKRKLTGGSRNARKSKPGAGDDQDGGFDAPPQDTRPRINGATSNHPVGNLKQTYAQQHHFTPNPAQQRGFQGPANGANVAIGLAQANNQGGNVHPRTNSNLFASTAAPVHHGSNMSHNPMLHSGGLESLTTPASASLHPLPRLQSNIAGSMCVASRDPFMLS